MNVTEPQSVLENFYCSRRPPFLGTYSLAFLRSLLFLEEGTRLTLRFIKRRDHSHVLPQPFTVSSGMGGLVVPILRMERLRVKEVK